MEEKLAPAQEQVNRIQLKRTWKPKGKYKPRSPHGDKKENACQFCGTDHKGRRSNCPTSGKTCGLCSKKVILLPCVKAKKSRKTPHQNHSQLQSIFRKRNRRMTKSWRNSRVHSRTR